VLTDAEAEFFLSTVPALSWLVLKPKPYAKGREYL
jgi:hypothetical protein